MFEGLDSVPWSSLEHAYSTAEDVPGLLRVLLDPDASVRGRAWAKLYQNVLHQGSLWEATPHVVPFLLELLEANTPAAGEVLSYLGHLLEGPDRDGSIPKEDGLPPEYEALARHVGAVRRTHEAARAGISIYRRYLSSPDPASAQEAARILAFLKGEDSMPGLLAKYHQAQDEVLQASLLWELDGLAAKRGLGARPVPEAIRSPSALVRLVEALSLVQARTPSPDAYRVLTEVLEHPEAVPAYADLPQARMSVDLDICGQLGELSGASRAAAVALLPALMRLLRRRASGHPAVAAMVVAAIAHLAFDSAGLASPQNPARKWRRPANDLTATQRMVLATLLEERAIWGEKGFENGNLGAVLNSLGLPTSWQELRDYLTSPTKP